MYMSDNNNDKYENIYVVDRLVKFVDLKEIFELQFMDGNANLMFSSSNQNHRELFKMLLSKYVPLCDVSRQEYQYRIPQVPISSDEMKSSALVLEEELKRFGQSIDDPALRRIKQLVDDIIHDIEKQLK
jgi:hypothetical protein